MLLLRSLLLACVVCSGVSQAETRAVAPSSAPESERVRLRSLHGGQDTVCRDYASWLESVSFTRVLHCSLRPPSGGSFTTTRLIPVAPTESISLVESVVSLLFATPGTRERRLRDSVDDRGRAEIVQSIRRAISEGACPIPEGGAPGIYRVWPTLDVDNDGTPDDVVFWGHPTERCDAIGPLPPMQFRRTFILVLNSDGTVNPDRSRAAMALGLADDELLSEWFGAFAYAGSTYTEALVQRAKVPARWKSEVTGHMVVLSRPGPRGTETVCGFAIQ